MSGNVTSDPPAEPALRVDTREELVYLLGQACEIEHGLMCEYLYAQFSLKRGPDEGLTDCQLARVQAWEKALITVIKQEMLHLALATNILTAIGAAPHFERPNFPILSRWYPPGVQIALVPFGERALRHFIYLERPEGMALDDAAGFAAARHAQPLTAGGAGLVAVPEPWRTVGHLYRGIEAGLAALCARYGEDAVFIGPPRAQAVTDIFEWPELLAVTDLASARQAIETIVEQGEGARGDWIKSHFGTFVGILEDLLAEQAAEPAFNPARPVEPAFVRLPPDVESGTLIEDLATAQVADLANGLYEVTLQVLSRYYIHHGETAAEVNTLARTAKHLMNHVMRDLGPVLTALPVGPANPGRTAGPAFDIARPAIFVLPHQDAAWKIITERLDALAQACASLSQQAGLSALAPLTEKLQSMSQDIAAHASKTASRRQRQHAVPGPARALTVGRDAVINPAVFTTTFLAAAVEIIEMVIIVVGVGAIRGWRSTLLGTGAGLAVAAALILALGTALTHLPINGLRVVAGSLLFVFGLQWLRKGIRRVAANGLRGMGARNATDDDIPAHGADWIAFLLAFRGVVLEGLEVAIIVATFGAAARAFPSAALAAAAALVIIGGAGTLARRLVERIPRSALQLLVGILLSAFGSFWATEGLGIAWPGADLFIIALAAWYVLAAAWYISRLRRQTRPASQLTPQHVR